MDLSLKHGRVLLLLDILRISGPLGSLISRKKCSCPLWEAARELGHQQGPITAERDRLNFDYANAVADVQNRNAQLNSQFQEAHINLSVRESNIAGAGNQALELRQQLEAAHAQLREREFNLGSLHCSTPGTGRHALTHNNPRYMRRRRGGTTPPLLDTLPTMA
ncbi:glycine dehydrogenase [Trypanosoma cruzi]|nr:glycine dehydrogenase [Trypanosoma cruzi]